MPDLSRQRQPPSHGDLFVAAASMGGLATVNAMLAAGTDANCHGSHNCSAILAAMDEGHEDCVLTLFLAGADLNVSNAVGDNLMRLSLDYKSKGMVTLCIAMGCDFSALMVPGKPLAKGMQKALSTSRLVSAVSSQSSLNDKYGDTISTTGLVLKALEDLQRELPEEALDSEIGLAIKTAKRIGEDGILQVLLSWRVRAEALKHIHELSSDVKPSPS